MTAPFQKVTHEQTAASERWLNQRTTEYFNRQIVENPDFKAWLDSNFVKVDEGEAT